MKEISILLFEKFSNHCLANILEPFRAANTLSNDALYSWRFFTLDGESVSSSSCLPIMPDGAFDPSRRIDDLFIVSSYDHLSLSTVQCRNVLRAARSNAKRIVGLDTGAWLMAAAGLLNGQKATIHWDIFDSFSEQFLSVETTKERFVVSPSVITCAGALAAFDLALRLIGEEHGEALRLDVGALLMQTAQSAQGNNQQNGQQGGPQSAIFRAMQLMQENLEAPLSNREIAQRTGLGVKTLERRFLSEIGDPPGRIYKKTRLQAARNLVENTRLPISEISVRVGYENAAALSRAFKQMFNVTPQQLRRNGLDL